MKFGSCGFISLLLIASQLGFILRFRAEIRTMQGGVLNFKGKVDCEGFGVDGGDSSISKLPIFEFYPFLKR